MIVFRYFTHNSQNNSRKKNKSFLFLALSLLSLSLLQPSASGDPVVNQCSSDMKFCNEYGYFDPIIKQRLFEGSIALYQSAFYNTFDETRSQFLAPSPSQCTARGYAESQ